MLKNKIFVTSRPNGSTLRLVKDIFKHTKNDFPEKLVSNRLAETNGEIVGVKIPYDISTKYYNAKVDFWLDEIDPKVEKETIKAYCEENEALSKVIDAFVFIFEKDKVDTFDTVKEWVPFIEQARPEIRVCIGTTSEIPLSGKQYAEIIDWCTAHQFDFVDMDEKSDIPMDKVGVDLVVDILQTNFWEGRKDRDGESAEGVDGIDISGLAGVLGSLSMASEQTDTTSDDALGELNEDNNDFEMPSSKDIDDMRKKLWTSMEEEDGLEKTFKLMQAMREQGKQMTDDERRKMAATVALAFSSQLSME